MAAVTLTQAAPTQASFSLAAVRDPCTSSKVSIHLGFVWCAVEKLEIIFAFYTFYPSIFKSPKLHILSYFLIYPA